MSPALPRRTTRRRPSTDEQRLLGWTAMIVAAVLALSLVLVTHDRTSYVVEDGETVELTTSMHSGTTHEVRLPTASVGIRVGEPVDDVDTDAVDLPVSPEDRASLPDGPVRPGDDGALLPVTWEVQRGDPVETSSDEDTLKPADEDRTPMTIRVVAGDQEIELVDRHVHSAVTDSRKSLLVPVDEEVTASEITVEVTYDGLTQVLEPETGDVDAGAAAPLYEGRAPTFDTDCPEGNCRLEPPADSPRRPSRDHAEVTPEELTLSPYDAKLGWAAEGTVWAAATFQVQDTASFLDEEGDLRGPGRSPTVTARLDGIDTERLTTTGGSLLTEHRATFPVEVDATPHELVIEQKRTLEGSESPRTVTLCEELEVDPGP